MDSVDIRKRIRAHLIAFGFILVLALTGAGASYIGGCGPAVGLGIAGVQVVIVLVAMMHLVGEGAWVNGVLLLAAITIGGLVAGVLLGKHSTIQGTQVLSVAPVPKTETH